MDIIDINKRIEKEICYETIKELSNDKLLELFLSSKSFKRNKDTLLEILTKYKIDSRIKDNIINDYSLSLISPGTKGVLRGNKFNNIIKSRLLEINLNGNRFDIKFEKIPDDYKDILDEIPDWYIFDKENNKILIGMNQLDLWSGGHQTNRALKYLKNDKYDNINVKLLCVVCNFTSIKYKNNKKYDIFNIGFGSDTLCYINNLKSIILNFFDLDFFQINR